MSTSSVRDVASLAGVSVGTVSNVLNHRERVAPETVERVTSAMLELGFVRNDAARQLRAGRSRNVGMVVLDVRNPFFTELARGAEDAAAGRGVSLTLGNSGDDEARQSGYLDLFEQQRMQGVLISPLGEVGDRLRRLRDRGTPVVLLERPGELEGLSGVSVDNVAGGAMAVAHLLAQGRRRIAYIASQFEIRQVRDRLAGARRAVAEVPDASLEIIDAGGLTVFSGRATGVELLARAPKDRPDAIFAVNDLIAVGLLQALVMRSDVRVPEDLAIVGYDDIDFAAAAVVPLTSVRQPSAELGSTAFELLMDEAEDGELAPRHIRFQPELVVRESTDGPRQAAARPGAPAEVGGS